MTYEMNGGLCMLCKKGAEHCAHCHKRSLSILKTPLGKLCMRCAHVLDALANTGPNYKELVSIEQVSDWLDEVLPSRLPDDVVGFVFNLASNAAQGYDLNLVGTPNCDLSDPDWACNDVWSTDGCRFAALSNSKLPEWETVIERLITIVSNYLVSGSCGEVLRSADAVGVGFVDGDLHLVWQRN